VTGGSDARIKIWNIMPMLFQKYEKPPMDEEEIPEESDAY
jgi:hypothetical protein